MQSSSYDQQASGVAWYFKNRYWVIVIAVFCSVLWGSAFPVLKVSYAELGMAPDDPIAKIVFAGLRFLLAALLLLGWALWQDKKSLSVKRHLWPELLLLGILQTSLQYFFFYNGLAHTSGMKAAILTSIGTFFVVILAHFSYQNDRLTWSKVIGLVTGFAGIVLVNSEQGFAWSFTWQGEGFLMLAGLVSAWGTILAKKLAKEIAPIALTGWQMLLGSILLLIVGLPRLTPGAMSFTGLASLLFVYSALLSAVAFSLWYALLKYNKAGEISIYRFMIPVSGAFLSAAFIPGEKLELTMLAALILVAVGIIAVNYRRDNQTESLEQ